MVERAIIHYVQIGSRADLYRCHQLSNREFQHAIIILLERLLPMPDNKIETKYEGGEVEENKYTI